MILKEALSILLALLVISCVNNKTQSEYHQPDIEEISNRRAAELDKAFAELVEKHKINTAAVAVIKNSEIVWQSQYGYQSPGIPATEDTLFDIASLTKTVTAETILRLVAQGRLSLDESIEPYWVDSDLEGEPLLGQLTPRMLLSHTSGFMNWRFFAEDGRLDFVNPPGTVFGYSGEGYEYLAKYAENKTGVPFEELVQATIFDPLDMQSASISVREENFDRIAKPFDENGNFYGYYCIPEGYCRQEGSYSAAASLVVTVADYARFLISAMNGEVLTAELLNDRNTMHGVQFTEKDIVCDELSQILCPTKLGYGLGWAISELKDDKLIGHRGTNWTVVSLAYYYQNSGDGLVVFFNAPNKAGLAGMIDALELLDPDSPEIHGYRLRLARVN
ncbi:MAG: hypothetical protein Tsb002_10650 [Wenzhouxiangellaceae bacterium]